ncbi:hypothetical protein Pcinc_022811 [Petrolisthes cinctipes]|uniref:Ubinuclein-1 n=1 Tax=Petrolisthes cinctipes TaxID=88211 RepID=A0AAE1FEW8_PETCI|nr:hypothetical protein Pcinc_022811 [Petrolisthes cinctipes]
MSETKKVAFSTLGPIKKEKKRVKEVKSLRIVLTLSESNEKSCPEFNYRELVTQKLHERLGKKSLGEVINGPSLDPTDPFATDEDAALRALARKLENKYGGYTGSAKKKRKKESDFKTLGEGYDESDPFIDNSDAFDEVVPTHLETKHRGFYINSGELDFETVAAEEEEEEISEEESVHSAEEVKKKKKPNQILSDDDEESAEEEPPPQQQQQLQQQQPQQQQQENVEHEEEETDVKKRKLYENGFIRHKKRKLDEGELLRKRKKMIGKFNAKNQEKKDSDQETDKPTVNTSDNKGEIQPREQSIKDSIEAVVNKAREEAGGEAPVPPTTTTTTAAAAAAATTIITTATTTTGEKKDESEESPSSSSNSSSSDSDSSGSSSSSDSESDQEGEEGEEDVENDEGNEEDGEEQEAQIVNEEHHHASDNEDNIPLPDNLPSDLTQVINKLKEEGNNSKLTSQSSQKFFTDSVNKLLLSIEMMLNKYGGRKKTQIYNHLSKHLPCGTQTIVKRAKNLLSERQESRLRDPLKRFVVVVGY